MSNYMTKLKRIIVICIVIICITPQTALAAENTAGITNDLVLTFKNSMVDHENNNFPKEVVIPDYSGFKTFMSYKKITSVESDQYKLQYDIAYTGNYGIRMVDERYCVAVGSGAGANVGDYGYLVLENGTIIPIIVGDIKADKHTDSSNLITVNSDCASEFIVDYKTLDSNAKYRGDMSVVDSTWDSKVIIIGIYDHNVFND